MSVNKVAFLEEHGDRCAVTERQVERQETKALFLQPRGNTQLCDFGSCDQCCNADEVFHHT